jgi:hypothetical protein
MRIRHFLSVIALISIFSIGVLAGTVSGRITGIAVDPSDPSSTDGNTIYVTTAGGGVWTVVSMIVGI